MEPNAADLRYFKLWILLDQIIWIWNIKGLQYRVLKILRFKYLNLFQRLNSFLKFWSFINLPRDHVRSQTKFGPVSSAVLTFIGYTRIDRQRETNRQAKYIYRSIVTQTSYPLSTVKRILLLFLFYISKIVIFVCLVVYLTFKIKMLTSRFFY